MHHRVFYISKLMTMAIYSISFWADAVSAQIDIYIYINIYTVDQKLDFMYV